jgi:hypothetical protein
MNVNCAMLHRHIMRDRDVLVIPMLTPEISED